MSRFIISNAENIFEDIKKDLNSSFKCLTDTKLNNLYIATYKKLAIDNKNTFIARNDRNEIIGILTCVGTFFYKKKFATNALEELWKDWNLKYDLSKIKSQCRGCFCISITTNEKCIIFNDDYNLGDCYYNWDESTKKGVVTNVLWNLAKTTKCNLDIIPAYEWCQQFSIIDNKTPYENIYRLKGNEYIEFSNNSFYIKKILLEERKRKLKWDYEKIIEEINLERKENAVLIKENFFNPSLCVTGGLDSRSSLAVLLSQNIDLKLLYWRGNSVMAGSETKDYEIAKKISEETNLKLQVINAESSHFLDNKLENTKWLFKLGEWYGMFGCNSSIFNTFENIGDFIDFGVGSNWLKDCKLCDFKKTEAVFKGNKYVNLETFIEKIYIKEEVKDSITFYEQYKKRIYDEFLEILKEINVEEDKLSKEIVSLFQVEYFKRAESKNYNLANLYTYSFPTLVTKNIYRVLIDTPYKYRENNHLVIDLLIRNSLKELVLIPFYSNLRDMKLNLKKLSMEETKKNKILSFILKFKTLLGKGRIYEFIKWNYHHINNSKQNKEYSEINLWVDPLINYIFKTDFSKNLNKDSYYKKIHFNPKIDLFFLLYSYENKS